MQGQLSDFLNVRPEEVTLEAVELLPANTGDGTYTLSNGAKFSEFEYVQIGLTTALTTLIQDGDIFDSSSLKVGNTLSSKSVADNLTNIRAIKLTIDSDTSVTVSNNGTVSDAAIAYFKGYKRRYSKTSLASIISVMHQKNMLLNTWHGSPKVRNQRGFDGDWSALAIGDYGLDGWFKYSDTHKAQIIEAGEYLPSTKTVFKSGSRVEQFTTPSDGSNFLIAVPFADDFMDCYHGDVERTTSVETEARKNDCYKYYKVFKGIFTTRLSSSGSFGGGSPVNIPLPNNMKPKSVTVTRIGGNAPTATTGLIQQASTLTCYPSDNTWAVGNYGIDTFAVDASLTLSDVTNDAQHRLVFG